MNQSAVGVSLGLSLPATKLGWLCVLSALLGAASGIGLLAVDPQVTDDRYSYPLSAAPFAVAQSWFFVQHLGLIAGQAGFLARKALGLRRAVIRGQEVAIAGMIGLAVTELLAISAATAPYPSGGTYILDTLYTVTTIAIGGGLVVSGVVALRSGVVRRADGLIALAIGGWVFVPMLPAIVAGFTPARLAITGWMLLYALLGRSLIRGGEPRRV